MSVLASLRSRVPCCEQYNRLKDAIEHGCAQRILAGHKKYIRRQKRYHVQARQLAFWKASTMMRSSVMLPTAKFYCRRNAGRSKQHAMTLLDMMSRQRARTVASSASSASHWAKVPMGPPDPIIGLNEAYAKDVSVRSLCRMFCRI